MRHLCLLTALLCLLTGCQTGERQKLTGKWMVPQSDETPEAHLILRSDNTFHVDLLNKEGIEVEGRYLVRGREITFINEKGTDAVSSDNAPGVYMFGVNRDALRFSKISDPLQRRSLLLSRLWLREAPDKPSSGS